MIAGCIERLRQQACSGCERRADCHFIWPEALGALLRAVAPRLAGTAATTQQPRWAPFFPSSLPKPPDARREPLAGSFRARAGAVVGSMLGEGPIRIDEVAQRLGCGRQTLYRRLKAEGVTFEHLVDDLRRRLALRLVRDTSTSVKEIAYRLGFSDPAAFSRAFKRWTGLSPRAMRAQSG